MTKERSRITEQLVDLGFSSPGWLGEGIETLAKRSDTTLYIRALVDLWERNKWQVSPWGLYKPIEPIRTSLHSPAEKLAFLVQALKRREALQKLFNQHLDTTSCFIQLGDMYPLEFRFEPVLYPGGSRFVLLDPRTYDFIRDRELIDVVRLTLGFVDFDWYNHETLLVNVVQDQEIAVSAQGDMEYEFVGLEVSEKGKSRDPRTITSNFKKTIRRKMRYGRASSANPHASETPGTEELLVYGVLEFLTSSGIRAISHVLIPKPEVTIWGNTQDGKEADTATFKSLTSALLALPPHIMHQLKEAFPEQWPGNKPIKPADFAWVFCDLVQEADASMLTYYINTNNTDTGLNYRPLGAFLVECVLSTIPDELQPSQQELASLGYCDNFPGGMAQFRNCLCVLATRTSAYHRTFHAYRTAFADITRSDLSPTWGRIILREDIARLPFTRRFRLTY